MKKNYNPCLDNSDMDPVGSHQMSHALQYLKDSLGIFGLLKSISTLFVPPAVRVEADNKFRLWQQLYIFILLTTSVKLYLCY